MSLSRTLSTRFFYSLIARHRFTALWYYLVGKLDKEAEVTLMNFGFAYLDGSQIPLKTADEGERYAIQLYDYVATGVPLRGKDVLEVGCGRGGGASYIARYLRPKKIVGVDIVPSAIQFAANQYAGQSNLQFIPADALNLPFQENSFDAVINIESAHHYGDIDKFLEEVHRVLRPGGHLLMACYEDQRKNVFPRGALQRSKLHKLREDNIAQHVAHSLDIDSPRREKLVKKLCPVVLQSMMREFAGIRDSESYTDFASGGCRYFYFVCRK